VISRDFINTEVFLQAIGVGYWEWDIPENILRYSREFISLLGNDEKFPSQVDISELKNFICAYDYQRFADAIDAYSQKQTETFSCDLRIRCGDGVERWFRARGKAVSWSDNSTPQKMIGTLANIDAEKNMEIALSQNQNRFQAIVDDETIMVCRFTRDGTLTYVNRTLCDFFGHDENHILGKSVYTQIHDDNKAMVIDQVNSIQFESDVRDFECRVLNSQGKYRWLHWRSHLIIDPITEKSELQSVGQDITESHNNLQSYNSRIEFDRLMVQLISRISAYNPRDLDKTIDITLSELGNSLQLDIARLVLFDHARESLNSTHEWCSEGTESARDLLHNQPFSQFPWCLAKIRKGETIVINDSADLPIDAASERIFFSRQGIKSACAVPLQTQGTIIGFLCLNHIRSQYTWLEYTPVLLSVLAEAIANAIEGSNASVLVALNEARERLFIDAIPALIVRIDGQGRVLDHAVGCHGTLSQYVAYHAPSSVNSLDDLFERSIGDQIFERLAASRREQKSKDFEFEVNLAGKPTTIEMKFSSSKDDETILVFQDISEKKNLEQLKNDFISNTTHEMRTPLTTILLMIDLMEKSEDTAKKDEYWSILKGEVMRERMLIEDLLTISRIEKGKSSSVKKQIDICTAIKDAVSAIQPQADGVGIRIITKVPPQPVFITGDANSCQMIFSNLLSNAIKFSPQKGLIEVSLVPNHDAVQLIFKDHGIGIPAEDLPGIFDRFYRGKNAISDEIQGSGIGLFIVDHLTRDMGGKVEVISTVGKGTTFTVEFPLHVLERVAA
jgi:PAS domain S-box-containing protein